MTPFTIPESDLFAVSGINDAGMTTGNFNNTVGNHSFVRSIDGTIIPFDAPGSVLNGDFGDSGTYAYGINRAGSVVGTYSDGGSAAHGFVRSTHGVFITFQFPASSSRDTVATIAMAINDAGTVAGQIYVEAENSVVGFVRTPDGVFATIGDEGAAPFGINLAGMVTGFDEIAESGFIAVLATGSLARP